MAIVDTRPFEKEAKKLIQTDETFSLQYIVSPNNVIVKEISPNYKVDNICDSYLITSNTFVPRKKTDHVMSEEEIDFSILKKIPRLTETQVFSVAGGIITQHVAIILSSGYTVCRSI